MNIVVLIKQVPEIELVKVDEAANQVVLPSGPGIVNPFDEYAVEEALRLKEKHGGKVTVMTLGSEKAESALRACLALGVDEAIQITDAAFEKSDPQAVAKILAAGLKKIGEYDLVLAGKQAVDDDSAQVPAAVAGVLDLPQAMFVKKMRIAREVIKNDREPIVNNSFFLSYLFPKTAANESDTARTIMLAAALFFLNSAKQISMDIA